MDALRAPSIRLALLALVALAALLVPAAGCYREPVMAKADPDTLVLVHPTPWPTLDPRFVVDAMSAKVSGLVCEPLVRFEDTSGVPELVLAREVSRLGGEPPIARVRLRPGVRFSDGSDLDCADVVHTYGSILDPALGSPLRGGYARRWRGVRCGPEPDLVDIVLQRQDATLAADLTVGIVPEGQAVGAPLVGTGPFQLAEVVGQHRARLERFDGYWGDAPAYRSLVVQVVPEESSRVLNLVAGAGDWLLNGVSPSVAKALEAEPAVRVVHTPSAIITYLLFNLRNPALADRRVRRALAMLVDREGITRDLFGGMAEPASSLLPPDHWAHASDLPPLAYDPAGAARLLDQAGLTPDPEEGVRLRVGLKVSNNRLRRLVGRRVASDLGQAGVAVELVSYELGTFLADIRQGNFDLTILQLPDALEPDLYRWMLYSSHVPGPAGESGAGFYQEAPRGALGLAWWMLAGDEPRCRAWAARRLLGLLPGPWRQVEEGVVKGNRTFYANPGLDCLLDLGLTETGASRRAEIYREVQRVVAEDLPVLPLWHEDNVAVVSPRLREVTLSPVGRYTTLPALRLQEDRR